MNTSLHHAETSLGPVSYRQAGTGRRKILFFHGFPGSSAQISLFKQSIIDLDIEVLCFDRPGYNNTKIHTEKNIQNTLFEVLTISEDLIKLKNWNQVEIVAVSGGTPYGLSLALHRSHLVSQVHVVCGLGYLKNISIQNCFSFFKLLILKVLPQTPSFILKKIIAPDVKKTSQSSVQNKIFEIFYPRSKADAQVSSQTHIQQSVQLGLAESLRQNSYGPKNDSIVFLSDWGKNLDQIKTPVHFWHGTEDLVISPHVSEIMQQIIPGSRLTLIPQEGHLSLPIRQMSKILQ